MATVAQKRREESAQEGGALVPHAAEKAWRVRMKILQLQAPLQKQHPAWLAWLTGLSVDL